MGDGKDATTAAAAAAAPADATETAKKVPTKRICCACPETKKARDACVFEKGEEGCKQFIEVCCF